MCFSPCYFLYMGSLCVYCRNLASLELTLDHHGFDLRDMPAFASNMQSARIKGMEYYTQHIFW